MPDNASSSASTLRQDAPVVQQGGSVTVFPIPASIAERLPARDRAKGGRALPAASFNLGQSATTAEVIFDHPDRAEAQAIYAAALKTTTEVELYDVLTKISYFAQTEVGGQINENKFNAMIQTVANMRPRDVAETMLCCQMVAMNQVTMTYAARLIHQRDIRVSETYERSLNRLARTYTTQMAALRHYRSSGKQRIDVRHVTVNEGGQAIVGDVTHGGPGETGVRPENDEATA